MTPAAILAAVADHAERLRDRAAHLERIGLLSGARWLRDEADRLEVAVAAPVEASS